MTPGHYTASNPGGDALRRAGDASVLILTSLAEAQNTATRSSRTLCPFLVCGWPGHAVRRPGPPGAPRAHRSAS